MEPKKMTPEELAQARKVADALNEEGTFTVHRLLAHLRALEAEAKHSGEARQILVDQYEAAEHEVETLMVRVREMEKERNEARQSFWRETKRRDAAESRLSAILRRLADHATVGSVALNAMSLPDAEAADAGFAVELYVVGEDGAGVDVERICPHVGGGSCPKCHPPASPEPSADEAFAQLRNASRHGPLCSSRVSGGECDCGSAPLLAALSRLERRMGAMGRALEGLKAAHVAGGDLSVMWPLWRAVDEALTDAPAVSDAERRLALLREYVPVEAIRGHLANVPASAEGTHSSITMTRGVWMILVDALSGSSQT